MRWVFILLLLCNGIYFVWQSYLQPNASPGAKAVPVQQAAQSLVLLSESPEVSGQPAVDGDAQPAMLADSAEPFPSEQAEPVASNICWLIGPFKEAVSSRQLVSRMSAQAIDLEFQQIEIEDAPKFWVHLAPLDSRKAAIKLLRELQNQKIDSFLVTEGELTNGISLGLFSQQKSAERVALQREKQGYKPLIKEVPRTRIESWALFDGRKYGSFSESLWDKVREGNAGLERHKNYCDKIASTSNFE